MITNTQLSMIEQASPGINWPGVGTLAGSQTTATALKSWSTLPTTSTAPVFYDPVHHRVMVQAAGTVLDGYDFRGVYVTVNASNVTIKNSTFDDATGYWAIREATGYNGLTVDHSTFAGTKVDHVYGDFISTGLGTATITNNTFLNAPSDAVQIGGGTISGNYFAGAGYATGAHADAINVLTATSAPIDISGNFVDWTSNADAKAETNNAIHIVSGPGVISNVSVHDNVLVGGTVTVAAIESTAGTLSNVSIDNNYIGFGKLGAFYSGDAPQVEASGNTVVDFSNLTGATQAWQAFLAAGIHTDHLVVEGTTVTNLQYAPVGTTTLYAGADAGVHLIGGAHETVFVSGAGTQYFSGGSGKNIFTDLTVGDSTQNQRDLIGGFHDNQDVFDLHNIDADPGTAGWQAFKFIAANAFDGGIGELHAIQNVATSMTYVEADLHGDGAVNTLTGAAGSTEFAGGYGADHLVGGSGKNTFTYLSVADSTAKNADTISSFHDNQDVIDLHWITKDPGMDNHQALTFIGGNGFSGAGHEVHVTQDIAKNMTYVEADVNGHGQANLHISIAGLHQLSAANLWL